MWGYCVFLCNFYFLSFTSYSNRFGIERSCSSIYHRSASYLGCYAVALPGLSYSGPSQLATVLLLPCFCQFSAVYFGPTRLSI